MALAHVMQTLLKDDTQVYKQFVENESFKRFVGDIVYAMTGSQENTTRLFLYSRTPYSYYTVTTVPILVAI